MKKLLIVLFVFIWASVFAQTEQGSYTLFNDHGSPTVNTYASLDGEVLKVNEAVIGSIGGTLGMTINRTFSLGGTGSFIFQSENEPMPDFTIPPGYELYTIRRYCWYAGLIMEPTLFPKLPIHLTISIVVGGGQLSYRLQEDSEIWCYYAMTMSRQSFFITSVGVRSEINVVDGFRISVGPSYRYVTNVDFLNGFALDISLKLGRY